MAWSRQSRHERGYGAEWVKARARIMARDLYLCQPCLTRNTPTPADEVDHITPKAEGGTDDDSNLQAICRTCHKDKTQAEAARAQGKAIKPRLKYDAQGYPIW